MDGRVEYNRGLRTDPDGREYYEILTYPKGGSLYSGNAYTFRSYKGSTPPVKDSSDPGMPSNPDFRGPGNNKNFKPEPKPPEKDYERNRRRNRPKFQRNDFTLNGNLLSEEKEGSVNFDGMGKAMIEMGLPEKKEDFVKEMGVLYALEGEINPQLLSMLLMAIAGEEFSDEQKKWLDSNLVPFIGGYANKVEKEQGGEEVKESIITDETKKRILREVRQPCLLYTSPSPRD